MKFRNIQVGFNLVELMIAMVLSTLLLSGVLQVFLMIKQVSMSQEAIARLQENSLSLSVELGMAIRGAGTIGCNNISDISTIKIHGALAAQATHYGLSHPEAISEVSYQDIKSNPLISYSVKSRLKPGLSALWVLGTAKHYNFIQSGHRSLSEIKVRGLPDYKEGDILVISDCSNVDIIRLQSAPHKLASQGITILPLTNSQNSFELSKRYSAKATVTLLQSSFYFIGDTHRMNTDGSIINGLFLSEIKGSTIELLEGIEAWSIRMYQADDIGHKPLMVDIQVLLNSVEPASIKPTKYTFLEKENQVVDRLMRQSFQHTWAIRSNIL